MGIYIRKHMSLLTEIAKNLLPYAYKYRIYLNSEPGVWIGIADLYASSVPSHLSFQICFAGYIPVFIASHSTVSSKWELPGITGNSFNSPS